MSAIKKVLHHPGVLSQSSASTPDASVPTCFSNLLRPSTKSDDVTIGDLVSWSNESMLSFRLYNKAKTHLAASCLLSTLRHHAPPDLYGLQFLGPKRRNQLENPVPRRRLIHSSLPRYRWQMMPFGHLMTKQTHYLTFIPEALAIYSLLSQPRMSLPVNCEVGARSSSRPWSWPHRTTIENFRNDEPETLPSPSPTASCSKDTSLLMRSRVC